MGMQSVLLITGLSHWSTTQLILMDLMDYLKAAKRDIKAFSAFPG